jgi:hypothetical protein
MMGMDKIWTALASLSRVCTEASFILAAMAPQAGKKVFSYSKDDVGRVLSSWRYQDPVKQARLTIDKYGMPDEVTNDRLIWYERGPWKRIEVQDMHLLHNFPTPHHDFISHVARYKVNPDKTSDCFKCDGSIIVEETAGEIGSRCHFEGANTLTTNMYYEIMEGQRDWKDAQKFMYEAITDNKHPEYMDRLIFKPSTEKEANNPTLPYPDQAKERGEKK